MPIFGSELVAKQLELLREVLPNATSVAVLANQKNPVYSQEVLQSAQAAARPLGLDQSELAKSLKSMSFFD